MRSDPDDYSAELPLPASGGPASGVSFPPASAATGAGSLSDAIPATTFAASRAFMLSDSAFAILRLAAAHDGVSEIALLTRLICQHATSVGLPGLLDGGDIDAVPEFQRAMTRRDTG